MTWLIRGVLALGLVLLAVLAFTSRAPAAQEAPQPTSAPAAPPTAAAPTLVPIPTATTAPFVERIVSRISRDTQVPYPTSTPLPQDIGVVNIVDFSYLPSVVRIHVGQSVSWNNAGMEEHDVTGDDGWYSGSLEPTNAYQHTFGFVGTFTYSCTVHRDMHGTVIVLP